MSRDRNRQVWLKSRPNGIPQAADFAIREVEVPALAEGKFLVRNSFVSVDPAMRGWIADKSTYWPRIEVGDTMRAFSVGEVIDTRNPEYAVGDRVMGIFGWQDFAAADTSQVMRKVRESDLPISLSLGVLGLNGLTAYMGLLEVCRPKAGETVVVSTAAGAVGSAVQCRCRRDQWGRRVEGHDHRRPGTDRPRRGCGKHSWRQTGARSPRLG